MQTLSVTCLHPAPAGGNWVYYNWLCVSEASPSFLTLILTSLCYLLFIRRDFGPVTTAGIKSGAWETFPAVAVDKYYSQLLNYSY